MSEQTSVPRRFRTNTHDEPMVKCIYCGKVRFSRGIEPHVRNSDGNGHGPYQSVPEDFSLDKCEVVGSGEISVTERVESESESGKELYVCHLCGTNCKGYRAFKIHLSKMEGKGRHPNDSDHLDPEMYHVIPADDDWNPIHDIQGAGPEPQSSGSSTIEVLDLKRLRSYLRDPDIEDELVIDELTTLIEKAG